MGTFHDDKGELHGITVVVDTVGPMVYVGRCHEMAGGRIVLHDVDVHEEREGAASKTDYIRGAAEVGVWKKHDTLAVDLADVVSVKPLAEYL